MLKICTRCIRKDCGTLSAPDAARKRPKNKGIRELSGPQIPVILVEATGLEPAASCSQSRHSTKLSYASITVKNIIHAGAGLVKRKNSIIGENGVKLNREVIEWTPYGHGQPPCPDLPL